MHNRVRCTSLYGARRSVADVAVGSMRSDEHVSVAEQDRRHRRPAHPRVTGHVLRWALPSKILLRTCTMVRTPCEREYDARAWLNTYHRKRGRCSSRRSAASGVQSGRGFMLTGQQACPWAVAHASRRSGKQPETRAGRRRRFLASQLITPALFTQARLAGIP